MRRHLRIVAVLLVFSMHFVIAHALNADQSWEQVISLAKKEGQVVVAGPPGQSPRSVVTEFQKAFPGIQLNYTGFQPPELGQRIMSERQAGRKLWDVFIGGANPGLTVLKPAGLFADLRSVIIHPEVKNDKNWHGGLSYGFIDNERRYMLAFVGGIQTPVSVNRAFVPRAEFSKLSQLVDPKFKGKIVIDDPRTPGIGAGQVTALMAAYGEDYLRRLLTVQEPVFTRNGRQLAEWMIRGRYPIAIGLRNTMLAVFEKQGVGQDVEYLSPERSVWNSGAGNVALFEGAPHPNAATVFINWLLTREAQLAWANATGVNSRRKDVPVVDQDTYPDPAKLETYIKNDEELKDTVEVAAVKLAKEVIK